MLVSRIAWQPTVPSTTWVTPFGLLFISAMFTAWAFARRNAVLLRVEPSHVDLIVPITIVVGIAGATAASMLMPMDHMVARKTPAAKSRRNRMSRITNFRRPMATAVPVFTSAKSRLMPAAAVGVVGDLDGRLTRALLDHARFPLADATLVL